MTRMAARPENVHQARQPGLLRDEGARSRAELGDAARLSRSEPTVKLGQLVEPGPVELGPAELGPVEPRSVEVGPVEVGRVEPGLAEPAGWRAGSFVRKEKLAVSTYKAYQGEIWICPAAETPTPVVTNTPSAVVWDTPTPTPVPTAAPTPTPTPTPTVEPVYVDTPTP